MDPSLTISLTFLKLGIKGIADLMLSSSESDSKWFSVIPSKIDFGPKIGLTSIGKSFSSGFKMSLFIFTSVNGYREQSVGLVISSSGRGKNSRWLWSVNTSEIK